MTSRYSARAAASAMSIVSVRDDKPLRRRARAKPDALERGVDTVLRRAATAPRPYMVRHVPTRVSQ